MRASGGVLAKEELYTRSKRYHEVEGQVLCTAKSTLALVWVWTQVAYNLPWQAA